MKILLDIFQSICTGLPIGSPAPSRPIKTPQPMSAFRARIIPLLLIVCTPFVVIIVWIVARYYEGSISLFLRAGAREWLAYIPVPSMKAVLIIGGWTIAQWLLLLTVPGKTTAGPVAANGSTPYYKQNAAACWFITHGVLFGILYPLGIINPSGLYPLYGSVLITLNIGAFVFCILLYIKGRLFPSTSDTVYTGSGLFDFFQGIELYPRFMGVSLKQFVNCRISMMGWSVINICFLITQHRNYGFVSRSMAVSVFILVLYLFKFFIWERGYLHSLDIMHDRFGYYICWGVLVWVPSIYCTAGLFLVNNPVQLNSSAAAVLIILGAASIGINYSADCQRSRVRDTNGKTTIWRSTAPRFIAAKYKTADGIEHENLLLVNGWWGIARHFHYVPELALAAAWTIPAGFTNILPWFYWIFLFILLMDRAMRDEKRCAKKYGSYWDEYKKTVRYRVFPGIF